MKKSYFLALLLPVLSLSSCCNSEDECVPVLAIHTIGFVGVPFEHIDSALIIKTDVFNQSDTSVVATAMITTVYTGVPDQQIIELNEPWDEFHSYRLVLTNADVYAVNRFEYMLRECKPCALKKGIEQRSLEAAHVNNERKRCGYRLNLIPL
jgi:hypothetical protein